ncbi:small membrane protein [Streptomyces lincolnensis]|uniref:Small membrane protein n=2 Tax=Streptomyces lincolnensis TaxID=1915 RepID=A0A1B1ME70_STRLN|nr:small membrane protein [Streptomyces lincolnensis]AXG55788.1 small membrane protein [Streptomyces lincolnensis]
MRKVHKVTDKAMYKEMYKVGWARLRALVCAVCGVRAVRRDAGMVTSEYAMGIVAAVAFAVVLYKVVTSGQVSAELQGIVKRALDAGV